MSFIIVGFAAIIVIPYIDACWYPIFIDYDDGLGTKWPPPPTPDTKISFCTSSLYPGSIGGSTISITRCQLCSGPDWGETHLIS